MLTIIALTLACLLAWKVFVVMVHAMTNRIDELSHQNEVLRQHIEILTQDADDKELYVPANRIDLFKTFRN